MSHTKSWVAEMPSNIALIKYMGKKDVTLNIPSNSSISWTLDHLITRVEIVLQSEGSDQWQLGESDYPFEMSENGRKKFINHALRIKQHFSVTESFLIRSSNNFPADCGIASSASSFAALTEAMCLACSEISGQSIEQHEKALLSSRGSGSSCRSFWPGLVIWAESAVGPMESSLGDLDHMVVLVGHGAKEVNSSAAHQRIQTSLLNNGRNDRAQARLSELLGQLQPLNWKTLHQIVWEEFCDMHALFETSRPSFSYFLPSTVELLTRLRKYWSENNDGPIVTMDAGPNIHLLWRKDQRSQALDFFNSHISKNWDCLSNIEDIGFAKL